MMIDSALRRCFPVRAFFSARAAGAAATLLLAAAMGPRVGAQTVVSGPASVAAGPVGSSVLFDPSTGLRRTPAEVSAQLSGFTVLPAFGIAFQFFHAGTGSPAARVLVAPPFTGAPELEWVEEFLLQFPANPGPLSERALVVAFHSFNSSANQIFKSTDLDQECSDRGWYLIAPLGFTQVAFGNEPSQRSLVRILELVDLFFDFNPDRIYAVGFSMGGGAALSFAARHLDPSGYRVAGLVNHTGTMDVVQAYTAGSVELQDLMANPLVFAGSPASVPFSYERVSPFVGVGGAIDPERALLSNVAHLPIYLHINAQDPNSELRSTNQLAVDWWTARGANLVVDEVSAGPIHSWSTLDAEAALDFVGSYSLASAAPEALDLYVDREERYEYVEVRSLPLDQIGRFRVHLDAPGNAFALEATKRVQVLGFDLAAMGLDGSSTLTIDHESLDGTADEIVLIGYPGTPAQITVNGLAPQAWSYSAASGELSITPSAAGGVHQIVVTPPA